MNVFLLSLAATLAANAQPEWLDDYGGALHAARTHQRPLLIVLEDSTARVPSRHVSHRPDAQHIPLLEPYVRCRIDVSTPYGRKVADAFRATSFPMTVVIDKTASTIIARKQGFQSAGDWTNFLTNYRTGQAPAFRPVTTYPAHSSPASCFT
jgi:hypothetical protein